MIIGEPDSQYNLQNPPESSNNLINVSKVSGNPQGGKINFRLIIPVVVILIIVVFSVLYFTGTLSHSILYSATPKTPFSNITSTVQLNNIVADLVNSSNAFNISYDGSYVDISEKSPYGNTFEVDSINSSVAKYGNAFEIFFNNLFNDSSTNGKVYITQNGTGLRYCTNLLGVSCSHFSVGFTPSEYIAYNYINSIIKGSVNYTSDLINNSFSNIFADYLSGRNLSNVSHSTVNVKYLGQSTYHANNCSEISESLKASIYIDGITGDGSVSSLICYSDVYGLPLSGYFKLQVSFTGDGSSESVDTSSFIISQVNKAPTNYKQLAVNLSTNRAGYNPTSTSVNGSSCGNFTLSSPFFSSQVYGECSWGGGNISLTYAGGDSGYASISITGQNGKSYFSKSTTDRGECYAGYATNIVYLPAQKYTISLGTGGGGGDCGNAFVTLS